MTFDKGKCRFVNEKSMYHFMFGLVSYSIGGSLISLLIMHFIWEFFQNSSIGKKINHQIFGRSLADKSINEVILDNIWFIIGWIAGRLLQVILPILT